MKTSIIKGHYNSYQTAYEAVGKRYKENGKYSIQQGCNDYRQHPWVLIYYGNWI